MKEIILFILILIIAPTLFSTNILNQKKEATISIEDITTDKAIYHSSEFLNLNVKIRSNSDLEDVIVKVEGIRGRFKGEEILGVKEGITDVPFSYKLPRCNVCGGIKAGDYTLDCEILYKDIVLRNSITINIQQ